MLFSRGDYVNGATASERNHCQLWVARSKNFVANVRRISIGTSGAWELVMSSTRAGNRPFAASPLPDGITLDGTYLPSLAEIWDQRSTAISGAQMFSGSGNAVLEFGLDEWLIKPNASQPAELGAGLMVRSFSNNTLWCGFMWEEFPA